MSSVWSRWPSVGSGKAEGDRASLLSHVAAQTIAGMGFFQDKLLTLTGSLGEGASRPRARLSSVFLEELSLNKISC